jgi:hypothetical protein
MGYKRYESEQYHLRSTILACIRTIVNTFERLLYENQQSYETT